DAPPRTLGVAWPQGRTRPAGLGCHLGRLAVGSEDLIVFAAVGIVADPRLREPHSLAHSEATGGGIARYERQSADSIEMLLEHGVTLIFVHPQAVIACEIGGLNLPFLVVVTVADRLPVGAALDHLDRPRPLITVGRARETWLIAGEPRWRRPAI